MDDEPLDLPSLCQIAVRAALLTEPQVQEIREEADSFDPHVFLRLCERKGYVTQWQSSKLIKGDTQGYFLGGYRVLYRIGSGSFGRVYRGDDPRTGRIVAIKVLRRRHMENQELIDQFIREGNTGMTLKHPAIVEILAVGQDNGSGQYYIVMEFVEGGNLREMLQIRGKFSVAESLRIIEDTASALVYAYSRGVTHRDMKLTNILISGQQTAKLVDFGLAQIFTEMGGVEKDKISRTVDYAGLERATNVKQGDVRSDIYFLGCVLYELLSGRPPLLVTKDKRARMQKQRFDNVVPISPNDLHAPASVFALVETMMALDPDRRYQTPAQLLDAIRAARRDVEGRPGGTEGGTPAKSLFIVEGDERLQDAMREKFKHQGYRVYLAGDPIRASDRFRQQPYDGLILDARTVEEDGLRVFELIMNDAQRKNVKCAGIVILSDEQAVWRSRIAKRSNVAIMGEHVTIKQLQRKLDELFAPADGNGPASQEAG